MFRKKKLMAALYNKQNLRFPAVLSQACNSIWLPSVKTVECQKLIVIFQCFPIAPYSIRINFTNGPYSISLALTFPFPVLKYCCLAQTQTLLEPWGVAYGRDILFVANSTGSAVYLPEKTPVEE